MSASSPCLGCEKESAIERTAMLLEHLKYNNLMTLASNLQQQQQNFQWPWPPLDPSLTLEYQKCLEQLQNSCSAANINELGSTGVFQAFSDDTSQLYEPIDSLPTISRKIFVGGLPSDISRYTLLQKFSCFGRVHLDFPSEPTHPPRTRKAERKQNTTGYVFVIYDEEQAVVNLLRQCVKVQGNFFLLFADAKTPKLAQVRPWFLESIAYTPRPDLEVNTRLTVFIGGVPRPIAAQELGSLLEENFGEVVYCEIDVDSDLYYPKGAARVVFASYKGYIRAIQTRFLQIPNFESSKRNVEIKPYIMEGADCDECTDSAADQFCKLCLQYYCKGCWMKLHERVNTILMQKHSAGTVDLRKSSDEEGFGFSSDLVGLLDGLTI